MKKHKRYLLFGYDTYYPLGGMNDLIDSFDTIEEAIDAIKNDNSDCHEIYDRIEGINIDFEA